MTTPGAPPRKGFGRALQATFVGGVLFLVPIIVLLIVLERALSVSMQIVRPAAETLPFKSALGLPAPTIVAVVMIVVFCLLAGLFARTSLALRIVAWLEESLLSNIPGYVYLKSIGESAAGVESARFNQVVVIRLDDAWQVGFLVERLGDGRAVVFLPEAPVPHSGTLLIVAEERIEVTDVAVPAALKMFKSLGLGAQKMLGKAPAA